MSDNRAWTGEENGAFAVLSEAHVILDSIIGKDSRPIAARLADVATDRARISALEAENAALKAERDAYRSQFWDKSIPDLVEMRKQRDDARAAFNVMDGCYKQAVAERDSETRWAHHYFTAWQTARQSRARLVGLVRHLRAWFSATAPDSAYVKRITTERDAARAWAAMWKHRAKAHRDNSKRLDREADALYKSCNEARAWAAAWRRETYKQRAIALRIYTESRRKDSGHRARLKAASGMYHRAITDTAQERRARRAAEAMERR